MNDNVTSSTSDTDELLLQEVAEVLAPPSSKKPSSTSSRESPARSTKPDYSLSVTREINELESVNKQLTETKESYAKSLRKLVTSVQRHKREKASFEEEIESLAQPVKDLVGDVAADFFLSQMRNNPSDTSLLASSRAKRDEPMSFTRNDLLMAFAIYYNSPNCYSYLSKVSYSVERNYSS